MSAKLDTVDAGNDPVRDTYDTLVQAIRHHGHACYLDGGVIVAQEHWTREDYNGQRRSGVDWVRIPATVQSVRDWLGY